MGVEQPLSLVVLGDSIAFGQGADRTADTLGPRLATALGAAGTPTRAEVLAVPGARSTALAAQVRVALAGHADLAVIVIGANDVTHLMPARQSAELLADAVRSLRAGGVQVVVAPTPDLSAVPWVPPQFRALARAASSAQRTAQTRAALAEGARVAHVDEALHAAFAADVSLFSGDRFHPSSSGYALIAQALLPAVTAAVADVASRRSDAG